MYVSYQGRHYRLLTTTGVGIGGGPGRVLYGGVGSLCGLVAFALAARLAPRRLVGPAVVAAAAIAAARLVGLRIPGYQGLWATVAAWNVVALVAWAFAAEVPTAGISGFRR